MADVTVVVLAVGVAVKNVALEQNLWTAVGEVPTAGRFNLEYSPNLRRLDAQDAGNGTQAIAR